MKPLRNVINEELRRAVRVLLKKDVKPDAAIAERAGCSVSFVRQVRAEIKAEKEEQQP